MIRKKCSTGVAGMPRTSRAAFWPTPELHIKDSMLSMLSGRIAWSQVIFTRQFAVRVFEIFSAGGDFAGVSALVVRPAGRAGATVSSTKRSAMMVAFAVSIAGLLSNRICGFLFS